ncbi:MAG: hypothetical protein R6W99_10105 [Clostridia bacterium]
MSYCVECGVELADYHKKCPLCDTPVYNPNRSFDFSKNNYPSFKKHHAVANRRKVVRSLVGFILSMSALTAALVPLIIDYKTSGSVGWSLYPLLSVLLLWICIAIPFFRKRNPFFKHFTLCWFSTGTYIGLLNLIADGMISWSRFVISSMLLVWILMAGIFVPKRIRKYVPVLMVYIVAAVGYFILLASWIINSSAIFSLVLPMEGLVLVVFLFNYFIIRSKLHGAVNYIILFLSDILILSLGFDLIITGYVLDRYTFTWSFIVTLMLIPMIIAAVIIKKRLSLSGVLSKRLHR